MTGEVTFVAAGKADDRLLGIAICGVAARMRGDPARPASKGRQMVTRRSR